jgi:hypothetical protein
MMKLTKSELDARLHTPRGSHNAAAVNAEYAHYLDAPEIDEDAACADIDAYFDEEVGDVGADQ